ncbi:uncharacterized protein B4U79_01554 [Dinothrombium tinctorium]|uniref:CABIT domain-containing protein n=1 Tax=Dinothrombium tinctorium TaxID=1965070 RepID=A0A443RIW0_9ACAR|nr:uncharacterized protein B4U79_01554 [Dinothrombium tinctorium]
MSSTEASVYLSAIKWGDEGYLLNELQHSCKLPQVAKIIKGQYQNLGVPSLSSPSLNQILFWANAGKRVKVAAQCVKFKESRSNGCVSNCRAVPVGPKLVIPGDLDGWFEILSEEGRAVKCIESVAELTKRFPESCLVRENIKAHLPKPEDPDAVGDKTRTVQLGETLILVNTDVISIKSFANSSKYLKCLTAKGETVFLHTDQKGKFSPIAKEDSISGVHKMKNLLNKRLPLMVRLVFGKAPTGCKSFVPEMRLYSVFEEECLVAMPLLKDSYNVTLVPVNAPLKLIIPKNADLLQNLREYCSLSERCNNAMVSLSDRIQVFDSQSMSKEMKNNWKESNISIQGHSHDHKRRFQSNNCLLVKRSISFPLQPQHHFGKENKSSSLHAKSPADAEIGVDGKSGEMDAKQSSDCECDYRCYDEIDQIYDYVRGFAPLPEHIKNELLNSKHANETRSSSPPIVSDNKPEPPPIETIPSVQQRRVSYPTIIHDISPKLTVNTKKLEKYFTQDHIYEKIGNKVNERSHHLPHVRIPIRSNSTGKIYLPSVGHGNFITQPHLKPKLFVKSSSGQRNSSKSNRLFKYSRNVPHPKDAFLDNMYNLKEVTARNINNTCRSLTTSPLFNIRYKSLTNLHFISPPLPSALDFSNTLESSNSGGQTSSGSAESKDTFKDPKAKTRKLSRPMSLTNLFWDMTGTVNFDKLQNEINVRKSNAILCSTSSVPLHNNNSGSNVLNGDKHKRVGTLYL